MQSLKIYSIHDAAAGAFNSPFFMANDVLAIRAIVPLVNDPTSMLHANPGDFTLFCLGEFNVSDGTLEPEPVPRRVRGAIALVHREKNNGQTDMFSEEAEEASKLQVDPNTGDLV